MGDGHLRIRRQCAAGVGYVIPTASVYRTVAETARTVAAALALHDIAHLIAGGLAVQEHGYPRMTINSKTWDALQAEK